MEDKSITQRKDSIQAIRPVEGFDPSLYLKQLTYDDGNGHVTQCDFLEVMYRTYWCQLYCKQNGIKLRFNTSGYEFIRERNSFVACCEVYFDDELVGLGYDCNEKLSTAQTKAKGRALADLGFGTLFCSHSEQGDLEDPSDTGPSREYVTPTDLLSMGKTDEPLPFFEGSETHETASVEEPGMTLKQALEYIPPENLGKGKSMGQINEADHGMIRFWAGDSFRSAAKYPKVVEAAKVILANIP